MLSRFFKLNNLSKAHKTKRGFQGNQFNLHIVAGRRSLKTSLRAGLDNKKGGKDIKQRMKKHVKAFTQDVIVTADAKAKTRGKRRPAGPTMG